jgi:hypothetical protein
VTDYPHVPELPIAQGIGTPVCGCLGFRGRVSEVRILPGLLPLFRLLGILTTLFSTGPLFYPKTRRSIFCSRIDQAQPVQT